MGRRKLALFAALALSADASHGAVAQQRELMEMFGNFVRSGVAVATQQAWQQLPPNELSCTDQILRERGFSVNQAIQEGVNPSDPRVSYARTACRTSVGQSSNASNRGSGSPSGANASIYSVDGLTLGARVAFGTATYTEYSCGPSSQFVGFTWCQRKKNERGARGAFTSSYSILHASDGTVAYVNRFLEPAWFSGTEANDDVGRLTKRFGAGPARTVDIPANSAGLTGLIALWGDVKLLPLEAQGVAQLGAGKDVRSGILVDHLGNFRRSAELNLPIYRVAGGPGYVWAASWDRSGTGTLRFFAADLPAPANQVAESPPRNEPRPVDAPAQARFSSMLNTPSVCEQLQAAETQLGSSSQTQTCPLVAECRQQLNERATTVDTYLKQSPEVSRWLREQRVSSGVRESYRDLGGALVRAQIPMSGNCGYDRMYIQRYWITLRGDANGGVQRPLELWKSAGRALQSDIQNTLAQDEKTYNELLENTDRYQGRDELATDFGAYKQSVRNEDYETALSMRAALLNKFEVGNQRRQLLDNQTSKIKSVTQLVSDWLNQLSGPLVVVADQATIDAVRQLKGDLDSLAERRDRTKADVSLDLNQVTARLDQVRPNVAKITKAFQWAKDLSEARHSVFNDIPVVKRRIANLPNSRLLPSETQKATELDKVAGDLSTYRPDDVEKQVEFQGAITRANTALSELRTAVSQQEGVDSLTNDIERLNSRVSARGRDLLDNKTGQALADLASQQQSLKLMKFPLNEDQLRTYSKTKDTFDRVSSDVDTVMANGEKRREVQRLGDQYSRESGTRWSLDQKIDPMTDKPDYKASSVQKNDEGAVAEIEARCAERGIISFTALVVDQDGKPTISFPNYNPSEHVLIGKRRFNGDDPQAAALVSDQFNNRFSILFLLGQPAQAQPDKGRQGNPVEQIQLLSKALQVGIVGAQKADETWRVLVQIETSRGSLILKIPTFERSIRKLVETCS